MQKKDKIFIAGGTGMVGSAILRTLQQKGHTNLLASYHSRLPRDDSVHWLQLDLTDQSAVQSFFSAHKPDYVFLAAAKVGGIMANNTSPADFIYQNMMIEANVIQAAHQAKVKRLLFLGSSCIYPREAPQPMKEQALLTGTLEPTNEPYAIAKIAGIKLCESFNRQYGTDFRNVMPTNLFGPGDNYDLENSHVIPALIRKMHLAMLAAQGDARAIERDEERFGPIPDQILRDLGVEREELTAETPSTQRKDSSRRPLRLSGEKPLVRIWGTGTPRREFLFVDDLASACVHIMNMPEETWRLNTRPMLSHINIGTGMDCTIKELARTVANVVGFKGSLVFDSSRPDGSPRKLLDITLINRLGWSPSVSLEQGLAQAFRAYQKEVTS